MSKICLQSRFIFESISMMIALRLTMCCLISIWIPCSFASTIPTFTVQSIDDLLARAIPGEDTVYIDDMGFKISWLEQLRDQLRQRERSGGEDPGSAESGAPVGVALWPGGVVPYVFNSNVNSTQRQQWVAACEEWQKYADVSFVPRTVESNYVVVNAHADVNNSYMGMQGGAQTINIASWGWKYIICHEIAHALGMCHEQSRSDRDSYVTIHTANILSGKEHNFNKLTTDHMGTPYDFESLMHYGPTGMARD